MKLYYCEEISGFDELSNFYLLDTGYGTIIEYDMEYETSTEYNSIDDFYCCWDTESYEKCSKVGKENFNKYAVMVQVL